MRSQQSVKVLHNLASPPCSRLSWFCCCCCCCHCCYSAAAAASAATLQVVFREPHHTSATITRVSRMVMMSPSSGTLTTPHHDEYDIQIRQQCCVFWEWHAGIELGKLFSFNCDPALAHWHNNYGKIVAGYYVPRSPPIISRVPRQSPQPWLNCNDSPSA
jgi:hypothetical protein